MKTRMFLFAALACILAGCCEKIDNETLVGTWYRAYEDERIIEDGSITYMFQTDGKCIMEIYNALGTNDEDATVYIDGTWSLSEDILRLTFPNEYTVYEIARFSGNRIWTRSGIILNRII